MRERKGKGGHNYQLGKIEEARYEGTRRTFRLFLEPLNLSTNDFGALKIVKNVRSGPEDFSEEEKKGGKI